MAWTNSSDVVNYDRKSTLRFITDLLFKYDKNQEWYIYGGYVRNLLIGIQNEDDIDIATSNSVRQKIIDDLIRQCRITKLIKRDLNIYPVMSMYFDSPSDKDVQVDLSNIDNDLNSICDLTINNFIMINKSLDINIRIKWKIKLNMKR